MMSLWCHTRPLPVICYIIKTWRHFITQTQNKHSFLHQSQTHHQTLVSIPPFESIGPASTVSILQSKQCALLTALTFPIEMNGLSVSTVPVRRRAGTAELIWSWGAAVLWGRRWVCAARTVQSDSAGKLCEDPRCPRCWDSESGPPRSASPLKTKRLIWC